MGKALYRQYRSTSFEEVIGQDHITTTLKNSLSSGSIGHAYLLTGPRGVGKTSVARILAFAVNGFKYQNDSTHLDIIEIDAASNRRIDEIRSLREKVNIAPTSGKYKVYIIDEVHMLTREAFNALLKTLEEPPAHVIFILATTEIHKLPDTIVSRCISFTFRPIDRESVAKHLKHIADSEDLTISKEALELLATHGEGSFRDSISLLDQVKNVGSKLEAKDIELALGLASKEIVSGILDSIVNGEPKILAELLQTAYEHGASETNLSKQIAGQIRSGLLDGASRFSSDDSLGLLTELLNVPSSPKPKAKLELCLLGQLFQTSPTNSKVQVSKPQEALPKAKGLPESKTNIPEFTVAKASLTPNEPPATLKKEEPEKTARVEAPPAKAAGENQDELWADVLQKLKKQNNTLYGIARMAIAEQINNKLSLCFKFPFHFRQVNQAKNKSILTSIIESLGHKNIELIITQAPNATKLPKSQAPDKTLSNITNIFGDHEVLES